MRSGYFQNVAEDKRTFHRMFFQSSELTVHFVDLLLQCYSIQLQRTTVGQQYLSLQNNQGFCGVQVQPSCPLAGKRIVNSRRGMTERLRAKLPTEKRDQVTSFSIPAFIYHYTAK